MMAPAAPPAPQMPSGLATARPVQNRQGPPRNSSSSFQPWPARSHSSVGSACRCQGSGTPSKWSDRVYPTPLTWRTSSWQTSPARLCATTTRWGAAPRGCFVLHPAACSWSIATPNASLLCLQEGHYNYELGENISSRCEYRAHLRPGTMQAQQRVQHPQQERSSRSRQAAHANRACWAPAHTAAAHFAARSGSAPR